jgi:hypothetical protein
VLQKPHARYFQNSTARLLKMTQTEWDAAHRQNQLERRNASGVRPRHCAICSASFDNYTIDHLNCWRDYGS